MMELYENSSDLNFNLVKSFAAKKNCETNGKCVIIYRDSYETSSSELDTMSHKQRNQANARERYRTHRYWFSQRNSSSFGVKSIETKWKKKTCLIYQSSMFSVNSAFNTLRLLIPTEPKNRKLSKIETLRLAKSYISHLNASLVVGKHQIFFTIIQEHDLLAFESQGNSRQPCFDAASKTSDRNLVDYRSNICTFCVSSAIHQKRIN